MKKILILIALFAVAGCRSEGVATEVTENSNYEVTKLFTYEGCAVYRFNDSRTIYYVNCGRKQSVQWTRNCGKNCYYEERVETGLTQ